MTEVEKLRGKISRMGEAFLRLAQAAQDVVELPLDQVTENYGEWQRLRQELMRAADWYGITPKRRTRGMP